jgi:O-antigen biosynthesis protein
VFGALLAVAGMSALRWGLTQTGLLPKARSERARPYLLIAGSETEFEEIKTLLNGSSRSKIIGRVAVAEDKEPKIATLLEVEPVAAALNARELILCSGMASNKGLIAFIQTLQHDLRLRFHAAGSGSIVGSDTSTASGEVLSATTQFSLAQPMRRRFKRLIDLATSLLFLIFFPLHFFLVRRPFHLLTKAVQVLLGKKTWIGYAAQMASLPPLRPAVLTPDGLPVYGVLKKLPADHQHIDFWYARNWEPRQDIKLIFKNYRRLGSC